MFKSKREYAYSIIFVQRSLRDADAPQPLGIIVQDQSDEEKGLFLVCSDRSPSQNISGVAQSVVSSLPQLVAKQVDEFAGPHDRLLEWLTQSNRGNVFFGPVQRTKSSADIADTAFELYAEQVETARARQSLSIESPRVGVRGFFENLPLAAIRR
jgi:hypothetical protein